MEDPVVLAKAAVEGYLQDAETGQGTGDLDHLRVKIDGVIDQLAKRVTAASDPLALFKGWLVAQPAGRQDQILGAEVGAAFRSDPAIKILFDWQAASYSPEPALTVGGVFGESGIPSWHQARIQEMLRNEGTEEEVDRTLEFLREGWTGGDGWYETPAETPARLRNDACAQRLKADFPDLWPNPHAVDWHPSLTPQALYAVAGTDCGDEPEKKIGWTLSWLPDMPGWETDGGREEYGLPRHVAEELAAAWNADQPGLWPRDPNLPPCAKCGRSCRDRCHSSLYGDPWHLYEKPDPSPGIRPLTSVESLPVLYPLPGTVKS